MGSIKKEKSAQKEDSLNQKRKKIIQTPPQKTEPGLSSGAETKPTISASQDDDYRFDRLIRIISRLIDHRHIGILEKILQRLLPNDIAYIIEFLGEDEKAIIFGLIQDHETMADIIAEMSSASRSALLTQRDPGWIANMVDNMESDDAADILAELPEEQTHFILKRIDQQDAAAIQNLMQYDEASAGGIMTTEFLAVSDKAKLTEVINEFRHMAENEDIEDIHSTFVIDDHGKLLGLIPLRKLILYKATTNVAQIMEGNVVSVNVHTDQEEVAALFKRHNLLSMPVVDMEERLVGRITIDDIVDVIDEETSEDIYRMAGVSIESNINASVRLNIKRRFPWLIVNLATAAISASVVGLFSSIIDQVAILAAFMPIVAGLGGNAGSQVIAIAVRSLALGELTASNATKVLIKEIYTGASNGLLLGVIIGPLTYLVTGKLFLGIIICGAMIMNVFTASIAGMTIPLLLKRMGVDPAVAANIFVTPMTDALGFFFFLGLAKIFLGYLL